MTTPSGPYIPAGFALQAATPAAGFALQNATPNIVSWTAPADGLNHRVVVIFMKDTGSNETGGAVSITATAPDGTAGTVQINAGGQATGLHQSTGNVIVKSGTTITVAQSSNLSGGSATVWVELWGS